MFSCRINDDAELRLLETRHTKELYQLVEKNREHLRVWLPWVDATHSEEGIREFIQTALNQFADEAGLHAGIFYKGKIVGCIGLNSVHWRNRNTSIGYWLDKDHQGLGIITGACRMLIGHVFTNWSLNRVEIRAAQFNVKSRAVPERLGFTQEGMIRQAERLGDGYVDHMVYGLLRSEWEALPSVP